MRRTAALTVLMGALLAAFFCTSTASATVLCSKWEKACPDYTVGTRLTAVLKPGTKTAFHAKAGSIECTESLLEGTTTNTGSESGDVVGLFNTIFMIGCSSKVWLLKYGSFKIHSPGNGGNGKLTWENFEITTEFAGLHCIYGGPVTLDFEGGQAAALESTTSSKLTRVGGKSGASCDPTLQWTSSYAFAIPQPLYVGGQWLNTPTVLCETATSPCSEGAYGPTTIEASLKSGEKSVLDSPIGEIECAGAAIKGEATGLAGANASGRLSSFALSSCNAEVKILKPGRFQVISPSGGNGTLVLEGLETTVETFSLHCVWGGPMSLSLKGGAMASIGPGATVPRIGGKSGAFCGSTAPWTIDYTITAPEPLYAAAS